MRATSPVSFCLVWLLAAVAAVSCGCDEVNTALKQIAEQMHQPPGTAPPTASLPPASAPVPVDSTRSVSVASFNIQVFGTAKSAKPHVMDVLARVVRMFDVVAIQEIRSKDDNIIPNFLSLINSTGVRYDAVVGPRLGRTVSTEQYAFIYNTARLEVIRDSVYTINDRQDLLHREPLVARFQVRGPPSGQPFSFTLVNIHTDPDETATEVDALADVFTAVQNDGSGEDDVILLGDLNVDERKLGRLGRLRNIGWVIQGEPTNTRRNQSYDNILFDQQATVEFTGRGGVLDLLAEFNLTLEQALEVSDHLPVWAVFQSTEAPSQLAGSDDPFRR